MYSTKWGKPKEIEEFLNAYNQPKLNLDELHNLNSSIINSKIEIVVNIFHQKKVQAQRDSLVSL